MADRLNFMGYDVDPFEDGWVMVSLLLGRTDRIVARKLPTYPQDRFSATGKEYTEHLKKAYSAEIVTYQPAYEEQFLMDTIHIAKFPTEELAWQALDYYESVQLARKMQADQEAIIFAKPHRSRRVSNP